MCIQGVQKAYTNVKYGSCLHDFLNSNLPTNIVVVILRVFIIHILILLLCYKKSFKKI